MSNHEIRMRRKMAGRGADRFRNYGDVLQRHERELRLKKILRVFSMVFVIMIVVMLIVIVVRIERRFDKKSNATRSQVDHRFR
ncbi:MAG TPA: hypothetical protein PLX35_06325 [Cyclobacteriaceae bacterium]|nr:hypothetical protein [Cyclobacteriaceae bacterium]